MAGLTPSQTVGPYFSMRLPWPGGPYVVPEGTPDAITIVGRLYDGAGNVIPDAASVTVNFRFAPDRSPDAALRHAHEVFDGLDVRIEQTDMAAGALPGLSKPAAQALVDAAAGQVRAKYGWTDVSRFAARGIPAVNYGPGDPNLAHTRDERVAVDQITGAVTMLRGYLSS